MPSRPRSRRQVSPNETISIAAHCRAKRNEGRLPNWRPSFRGREREHGKRCLTVPLARRLDSAGEATRPQTVKKRLPNVERPTLGHAVRIGTVMRVATLLASLALVIGCVSPTPTPSPTTQPTETPAPTPEPSADVA